MSKPMGLEITLENGEVDCFDPVCMDAVRDSFEDDSDRIDIDNGYGVYNYAKDSIRCISFYELTPCCGYDVRLERHSQFCKGDKDVE